MNSQRKQAIEDLGAAAGEKLRKSGLVPNQAGLFTVLCPACRWHLSETNSFSLQHSI